MLVIVGGNHRLLRAEEQRPGVTTVVAMLIKFAAGNNMTVGSPAVAGLLLHLNKLKESVFAYTGFSLFSAP